MAQGTYLTLQPTNQSALLEAGISASGQTRDFFEFANYDTAVFYLTMTAATSGTSPTLDVYIDELDPFMAGTSATNGYVTLYHFPQLTGSTTQNFPYRAVLGAGAPPPAQDTGIVTAPGTNILGNGNLAGAAAFGQALRVRWVLGGTAGPVFSVRIGAWCKTAEGVA